MNTLSFLSCLYIGLFWLEFRPVIIVFWILFDLVWPSLNYPTISLPLYLKLDMWEGFCVDLSSKWLFNFIKEFFFELFFSEINVTDLTSYFFLFLGINLSPSLLKCILVPKIAFRLSFPCVKDSRIFCFSSISFWSFSTVLWSSLFTLLIASTFSLAIFVSSWYFYILIFNSSLIVSRFSFSAFKLEMTSLSFSYSIKEFFNSTIWASWKAFLSFKVLSWTIEFIFFFRCLFSLLKCSYLSKSSEYASS